MKEISTLVRDAENESSNYSLSNPGTKSWLRTAGARDEVQRIEHADGSVWLLRSAENFPAVDCFRSIVFRQANADARISARK